MPRDEPTVATPAPSNDYAAQFNPGFALDPARVALVVVDMQYASGSRKEGLGRLLAEQGNEAQGAYRFDRIEARRRPDHRAAARRSSATRSLRVIYLTVGSELPDYSDLPAPHARRWRSSSAIPRAAASTRSSTRSRRARGEAVHQQDDDERVSLLGLRAAACGPGAWSSSSSPGVSTNSCVEGTARDAADRGFRCLLVEDGCGAASQRLHDAACQNFQRLLGRVDSSAAVIEELAAALGRAAGR